MSNGRLFAAFFVATVAISSFAGDKAVDVKELLREAKALALAEPDSKDREHLLEHITEVQVNAGDIDGALATTKQLSDDWAQRYFRSKIAIHFAKFNENGKALELAFTIDDDRDRYAAIASIVQEVA